MSPETAAAAGRRPFFMLRINAALEKWDAVAASEAEAEQAYIKGLPGWDRRTAIGLQMRPLLALAKAHLGDLPGAKVLIAVTPGDCYDCMRYRGVIASLNRFSTVAASRTGFGSVTFLTTMP